jgi:hypothetical protein
MCSVVSPRPFWLLQTLSIAKMTLDQAGLEGAAASGGAGPWLSQRTCQPPSSPPPCCMSYVASYSKISRSMPQETAKCAFLASDHNVCCTYPARGDTTVRLTHVACWYAPGPVVAQDLDRLVEALITEQRDNVRGQGSSM